MGLVATELFSKTEENEPESSEKLPGGNDDYQLRRGWAVRNLQKSEDMILRIQTRDCQTKMKKMSAFDVAGQDCVSPDGSRDDKVRENLVRVAAMP